MKRQHLPWYFGAIAVVISIALGLEKLEWAPWDHVTEEAAAASHGKIEAAAAKDLEESEKDALRERDIMLRGIVDLGDELKAQRESIEKELDTINGKLWNIHERQKPAPTIR